MSTHRHPQPHYPPPPSTRPGGRHPSRRPGASLASDAFARLTVQAASLARRGPTARQSRVRLARHHDQGAPRVPLRRQVSRLYPRRAPGPRLTRSRRHGNRLDAADKKWHLSSPTPYDPPLTYGGLLQARQVGNHIGALLEQASRDDQESRAATSSTRGRKRFKVVIHTSPFLRCVQTSIGISSGLAQVSPDAHHAPAHVIVPRVAPPKSALLRLDSFLGEWLSPEYFEMITPPPGPALMLGGAKADLLRREDYSAYTDTKPDERPLSGGRLWHASSPSRPANGAPSPASEADGAIDVSALASALPALHREPIGYAPPTPLYASTSGKIPDGFVAHARDACLAVDYQWDSMRDPLDFGDGGKLGEEWAAVHMRFRGGLRKLVNWYATTESAADLMSSRADSPEPEADGDAETVVIIVSHGAGCNALIGAITHQPVLMDVGLASVTMATRKPHLDYAQMLAAAAPLADPAAKSLVHVDKMYDMRLYASTEHLRSLSSTPVSSRPTSTAKVRSPTGLGYRGRTSTLGIPGGSHEPLDPSRLLSLAIQPERLGQRHRRRLGQLRICLIPPRAARAGHCHDEP